jgi:hypothetical protein
MQDSAVSLFLVIHSHEVLKDIERRLKRGMRTDSAVIKEEKFGQLKK